MLCSVTDFLIHGQGSLVQEAAEIVYGISVDESKINISGEGEEIVVRVTHNISPVVKANTRMLDVGACPIQYPLVILIRELYAIFVILKLC